MEKKQQMTEQERRRKWTVFKEYYLPYILVGLIFLVLIVTITVNDFMGPDEAFFITTVDVYTTDKTEEYLDEFLVYSGLNTEDYSATYRSFILDEVNEDTINSIQTLVAYMTAGQLDAAVMDHSSFATYAYMGMFADLRDYMTEEQLAQFEGKIFYIEAEDLESAEGIQGETIDFETYGSAEGTTEPVPIGINLSECGGESYQVFINANNETYFGIISNSGRPDMCQKFVNYVLELD